MMIMTTTLPFQAQQPIFSRVGGISELSHMDSDERRRYFYSLNKYRTNQSVMENERYERSLEIARNAIRMGMEYSVISQLTGLSVDEIEKL